MYLLIIYAICLCEYVNKTSILHSLERKLTKQPRHQNIEKNLLFVLPNQYTSDRLRTMPIEYSRVSRLDFLLLFDTSIILR